MTARLALAVAVAALLVALLWRCDDASAATVRFASTSEPTTTTAATTTTIPPPTTTTTAPPPRQVAAPARSRVWDLLARCESGGNWAANTGNGFYGGLQFTLASWHAVGGVGYPHQHSRAEQIARAERLQRVQGWGAWPVCSRKVGLR